MKETGATFVEIMVASALLALVILGVSGPLLQALQAWQVASARSFAAGQVQLALRDATQDVQAALSVTASGSTLTYQTVAGQGQLTVQNGQLIDARPAGSDFVVARDVVAFTAALDPADPEGRSVQVTVTIKPPVGVAVSGSTQIWVRNDPPPVTYP